MRRAAPWPGRRLTLLRQGLEHIEIRREALDMGAVPERIEEQRPGGKAVPLVLDRPEQLLNRSRHTDLGDAGLTGDERAKRGAAPLQPFADRHRETLLARH